MEAANLTIDIDVASVNDQPMFLLASRYLVLSQGRGCAFIKSGTGEALPLFCNQTTPLRNEYRDFAYGMFLGPFEGQAPASCMGLDVSLCENQTGVWSVMPRDSISASSAFSEMPHITPQGSLIFTLEDDAVGTFDFEVVFEDDGVPPASASANMSMIIIRVNKAPYFYVPGNVSVVQGFNGTLNAPIVDTLDYPDKFSTGLYEPQGLQNWTFFLDPPSDTTFFLPGGLPTISNDGKLTFALDPEVQGRLTLTLTATDTGGTERKGADRSSTYSFDIIVRDANTPPTFTLNMSVVTVEETDELIPVAVPNLAIDIRAGPDRERGYCGAGAAQSGNCQNQSVVFVVDYVEHPSLFAQIPTVDAWGTLHFVPAPQMTGSSRVYFRAEDSGWTDPITPISNSSSIEQFVVVVEPGVRRPSFSLGRNLTCLEDGETCNCPALTQPQNSIAVCGRADPNATASVTVLEGSDRVVIKAFATDLTPAAGYVHNSFNIFSISPVDGTLTFRERRAEPLAGGYGLEYASDTALSPDGKFVYATEKITKTVSVFDALGGDGDMSLMPLVDRMASRSTRLALSKKGGRHRIGSLTNLAAFQAYNRIYAAASTGGPSVRKMVERIDMEKQQPASRVEWPSPVDDDLWAETVGYWSFDLESVFAPAGFSATTIQSRFTVTSGMRTISPTVSCLDEVGCSFSRTTTTTDWGSCVRDDGEATGASCSSCTEANPTLISRSTVRDQTSRLGPFLLPGPACKSRGFPFTDDAAIAAGWDAPSGQQADLMTFIMNNRALKGGIQFDGAVNPGLFLTHDLDRLPSGALPTEALTIEMWLTIDETQSSDTKRHGIFGAEDYRLSPSSNTCARGVSLSYFTQASGEIIFEFRASTAGTSIDSFDRSTFVPYSKVSLGDGILQAQVSQGSVMPGEWFHLAATYGNGSLTLFKDGTMLDTIPVCDDPPCGDLVWPSARNATDSGVGTCNGSVPTSLTLGMLAGLDHERVNYPLVGSIRDLRIYDVDLSTDQINASYTRRSEVMRKYPLNLFTTGHFVHADIPSSYGSPSADFADAAVRSDIVVGGFFEASVTYSVEWTNADRSYTTVCEVSADSLSLKCITPIWEGGTSHSEMWVYEDRGLGPQPSWMRVCLFSSCGFIPFTEDRSSWRLATHDTSSGNYYLQPNVNTLPILFRFISRSRLFVAGSWSTLSQYNSTTAPGSVDNISIVSGGENYDEGGELRIPSTTGTGFRAVFTVLNGSIDTVTVVDGGVGYSQSDADNVMPVRLETGKLIGNQIVSLVVDAANNLGANYIAGDWAIPGGTVIASGTFSVDDSGTPDQFTLVSRGAGYASTPASSEVKLYFAGTLTEQIGNILRVDKSLGLVPLPESAPAVALCFNASDEQQLLNCSGSGFAGTCISISGFFARVEVSNFGSGYNPSGSAYVTAPQIKCETSPGVYLDTDTVTLTAVIPTLGEYIVTRSGGAAFSASITPHQDLTQVDMFGIKSSGRWSESPPLFTSASSMTHFQDGGMEYIAVSSRWGGGDIEDRFLTNAGLKKSDPVGSHLFSLHDSPSQATVCLQTLPTVGAQKMIHFAMQGRSFLSSANFWGIDSDGKYTTTGWSQIYTFNSSKAGAGCLSSTPSDGPAHTEDVTQFRTYGATDITTLEVDDKARNGQVLLMVVANYYDSELQTYDTPSRIYKLGVPVSTTQSKFGANEQNYGRACDGGEPCQTRSDCSSGFCDANCVVTSSGGSVSKTCYCSNNNALQCTVDDDCNSLVTCALRNVDLVAEDHRECWASDSVSYLGGISGYGNRVTMCLHQDLPTVAARSVSTLVVDGTPMLVFASDSVGPSPVFRWNNETELFELLQSLETSFSSSAFLFRSAPAETDYILISSEASTKLLRWNRTSWEGELTAQTLPADAAGGQELPYIDSAGVSLVRSDAGTLVGGNSDAKDVIFIASEGSGIGFGDSIMYVSAISEFGPLDGPMAVMISPDGAFAYVASEGAIAAYSRDSGTGKLTYLPSVSYIVTSSASDPPADPDHFKLFPEDPERYYGYPLRGLSSVILNQNGTRFYATDMFDDCLHVFDRDETTGSVTFASSFCDAVGRRISGPRSIRFNRDETIAAVVSANEHAVSVFSHDPATGQLTIIDVALQGERDVSSMPTVLDESIGSENATGAQSPRRIEGINASSSLSLVIFDGLHFAASGSPSDGGVSILSSSDGQDFSEVQRIPASSFPGGVTDVELFLMGDSVPTLWLAASSEAAGVHVLAFSVATGMFHMHHSLPSVQLPIDMFGCSCLCEANLTEACFDGGYIRTNSFADTDRKCGLATIAPAARSIRHFVLPSQHGSVHFIAAAIARKNCTHQYSMVYRWGVDVPRLTPEGVVWGNGFQAFQAIPTNDAESVDFVATPDGTPLHLLIFSSYGGGAESTSPVFKFDSGARNPMLRSNAGVFTLNSSIPTTGCSAIRPFSMPGIGLMLAVANRQSWPLGSRMEMPPVDNISNATLGPDQGDLVYDARSFILRWNGAEFEVYQDLEVDRRYISSLDGPAYQGMVFAQDRTNESTTSRFRGATDMHLFTSAGETYLLIAQSVCDRRGASDCEFDQPRSAVLQWDRVALAFTELLAMTDEANILVRGQRVRDADLRLHQAALRIQAGRARKWAVSQGPESTPILIVSSHSLGLVAYRMAFTQTVGLGGAIDSALSPSGEYVYVVSRDAGTLAVLKKGPRIDSIGNIAGQLTFVQSWPSPAPDDREANLRLNGVRGIWQGPVDCGGYSNVSEPLTDVLLPPGTVCEVVAVRGFSPSDALPCGPAPPMPAIPLASNDVYPKCIPVNITTVPLSGDYAKLFAEMPQVIGDGPDRGSLTFTLNPRVTGAARFLSTVQPQTQEGQPLDSSSRRLLSSSVSAEFEIKVATAVTPPEYQLFEIVPFPAESGNISVPFARLLLEEERSESYFRDFYWEWSFQPFNVTDLICPDPSDPFCDQHESQLFATRPRVFYARGEDNRTYAYINVVTLPFVSGSATVYVSARNIGGGGGARGGGVQNFTIVVQPINHAPSFDMCVTIPNQAGGGCIPNTVPASMDEDEELRMSGFVSGINKGAADEEHQQVNFSLSHVENMTDNPFDMTSAVTSFGFDMPTFEVSMTFAPNLNGLLRVWIRIQDDGGTALTGQDSGYQSFLLQIAPVNDAPELLDNGARHFVCSDTSDVKVSVPISSGGTRLSDSLGGVRRLNCEFDAISCSWLPQQIDRSLWISNLTRPAMLEDNFISTIPWNLSSSVPADFSLAGAPTRGPFREHFVYISHASQPGKEGDFAFLTSPILKTNINESETTHGIGTSQTVKHYEGLAVINMSFYYVLGGAGVGSLSVEARIVDPEAAQASPGAGWQTVWTRTGEHGMSWLQGSVDIGAVFPEISTGAAPGWQVRFKATRGIGSSGVIALATVEAGGIISTRDVTVDCEIAFLLEPSRFGARRVVSDAFIANQPADEAHVESLNYSLIYDRVDPTFARPPEVYPNGTAVFYLAENAEGIANNMKLRMNDDSIQVCGTLYHLSFSLSFPSLSPFIPPCMDRSN